MAKSSYNINNVYKDINTINGYFNESKMGPATVLRVNGPIHTYCHYGNNSGKGNCPSYIEMVSSGVIYVLKTLKEKYDLDYDKLAEYAILWLRYKLNQAAPYNNTKLNDFYNNHIEKNKYYNNKIKGDDSPTYKEIIDKKKDLMNININEISKYSYPFSLLLFLYNENKTNNLNCTKYLGKAKDFASRFEGINKDPNNIEGSSYNKILSTIS
ncbi:PIR protein CIR protein, partial [Plasmodium vinckei brucechwatti]